MGASEVHTECCSKTLKRWETGLRWKIILKLILEKVGIVVCSHLV
jgi:hypothetical protein